jgi:hypothetical protein
MWSSVAAVVLVLAAFVPSASTRVVALGVEARQTMSAQFTPGKIALASTGRTLFVLGFRQCGGASCPELWSETGGSFIERVAPPRTTQHDLGYLVFANALDGYALESTWTTNPGAYSTTNGGTSWRLVLFGAQVGLVSLVASDGWFYGVTVHCMATKKGSLTCDDYRLARSRVGSMTWSSIPIPGTSQLTWQTIGLTAWGGLVTVQTPTTLLRSVGGRAPWQVIAHDSDMFSVTGGCGLTASSSSSMWAICSTGMMAAWFHSSDGGSHFKQFWWPMGTAGTDLDPVSGNLAFRYTGIELPRPGELQRTTNGGVTFLSIRHLPFTALHLEFLDAQHGYVLVSTGSVPGAGPFEVLQTSDGGHTWSRVLCDRIVTGNE